MSIAISARRLAALAAALTVVAPAVPAAAQAAGPPTAVTGGVTDRTTTTVTLNGRLNPNGATTRFYFQIGTTRNYTSTTGVVVAGDGTKPRRVSAPVSGLAPATTYHYRLVAENRFDIRRGEDRTFRTRPEPLGINLTATPNPVLFNASTVVSGTLTGTGNAGRQVVLQTDPWPYDGFANAGNGVVTDATGAFSFPILALTINTNARVVVADKPEVTSPQVLLQALPRVTTKLRTKRYRRSKRVRFSGVVTPAVTGEQMQVQRLVDGSWEVVRTMRAKARKRTTASSRYEKSMLIRNTGRYRVVANISSGAYTSSPGREVRIKVKKRKSRR